MAVTRIQQGEVRQLGIEVTSINDGTFTIDTADYKVYRYEDKDRLEPVDDGYCEIIEHKIVALFAATSKGTYIMEITYRIHPEILKADIIVSVV